MVVSHRVLRSHGVRSVKSWLMEERVGRLPWSRELFLLFFFTGFRFVVWNKSFFKASGIASTLCLITQSVTLIVYGILFKSTDAIFESVLPRKFSNSPIKTDLDAFITGSFIAKLMLTSAYIFILSLKRDQIAQVLNHLNSLWLR